MSKFTLRLVFVIVILLLSASSAIAQPPVEVYVDTGRTDANEDGSQANPYNTTEEGEAYAQSLPGGANLYVKENGVWVFKKSVPPVVSGGQGIPLPRTTLYIMLAILALVLVLVGWLFLRRANQLQGTTKLRTRSYK